MGIKNLEFANKNMRKFIEKLKKGTAITFIVGASLGSISSVHAEANTNIETVDIKKSVDGFYFNKSILGEKKYENLLKKIDNIDRLYIEECDLNDCSKIVNMLPSSVSKVYIVDSNIYCEDLLEICSHGVNELYIDGRNFNNGSIIKFSYDLTPNDINNSVQVLNFCNGAYINDKILSMFPNANKIIIVDSYVNMSSLKQIDNYDVDFYGATIMLDSYKDLISNIDLLKEKNVNNIIINNVSDDLYSTNNSYMKFYLDKKGISSVSDANFNTFEDIDYIMENNDNVEFYNCNFKVEDISEFQNYFEKYGYIDGINIQINCDNINDYIRMMKLSNSINANFNANIDIIVNCNIPVVKVGIEEIENLYSLGFEIDVNVINKNPYIYEFEIDYGGKNYNYDQDIINYINNNFGAFTITNAIISTEDISKISEYTSCAFKKCIIKNTPNFIEQEVKYISLENCMCEENTLACFNNLQTLNIVGGNLFVNDLIGLKQLENLYVYKANIINFDKIGQVDSLKVLSLDNCGINSLEPIKDLTKLTQLMVSRNEISNIDVIENLPLTWLDVIENNIEDFQVLSKTNIGTALIASNVGTKGIDEFLDKGGNIDVTLEHENERIAMEKAIISQIITDDMDEKQKISTIYEYFKSFKTIHDESAPYFRKDHTWFALKNGGGVCAHFALLVTETCKLAGIKNIHYVVGYTSDFSINTCHAWVTYIENGKEYLLDPTWDIHNTKENNAYYMLNNNEVKNNDQVLDHLEISVRGK